MNTVNFLIIFFHNIALSILPIDSAVLSSYILILWKFFTFILFCVCSNREKSREKKKKKSVAFTERRERNIFVNTLLGKRKKKKRRKKKII